ncbi:MAG: SagB/ThcOx family dehydrogenase [Desulfobacterales bacterium]|jgi:SagB-type dehydrogenase family enzyme
MIDRQSAFEAAVAFHNRTKHHFHRYARSAGYMDWGNQPSPFRFHEDTLRVALPLLKDDPPKAAAGLSVPKPPAASSVDLASLSGFLELSMGLSAWKAQGDSKWALRINPSSGNLHPTELYLLPPPLAHLKSALYHYSPYDHCLETRLSVPPSVASILDDHFGGRGVLIALSTIYWREAWKYGERAYRYCHLDIGHALAALSFSARLWGWRLTVLDGLGEPEMRRLTAGNRVQWLDGEEEYTDLIGWVSAPATGSIPNALPPAFISAVSGQPLQGRPAPLGGSPVRWHHIYRTAEILGKPTTVLDTNSKAPGTAHTASCPLFIPSASIIRQRRSAVAFEPKCPVTLQQMISILCPTLPLDTSPPFDSGFRSEISLMVFVHEVDGLEKGLYGWIRHPGHLDDLKAHSRQSYSWEIIDKGFPLYRLARGDFKTTATRLCCHQAIAGDGCFSLMMVGRFEETLKKHPWRYPQLFWEAGMIGHVLYLAAEAQGVRGTGIGCYFDDPVHELLGLASNTWQSLYHFTIGHPIEDNRINTLPPYGHIGTARINRL